MKNLKVRFSNLVNTMMGNMTVSELELVRNTTCLEIAQPTVAASVVLGLLLTKMGIDALALTNNTEFVQKTR